MIAFGVAENSQQVEELIKSVDFDNSGKIEFEEFLTILQGSKGNEAMANFFKGLIEGTLFKDSNMLPFKLVVSAYRRKMLVDALMSKDQSKKEKGNRIMKAFSRQITLNRKKEEVPHQKIDADLRGGFPRLPRITDDSVPKEPKTVLKRNK